MDATAAARLDIPAAFGTDNDAFVFLDGQYLDDPGYTLYGGGGGGGVHRVFTPELEGETGLAYHYTIARDDLGERRYSFLSLPTSVTWDRRDNQLDPTAGTYVLGEAEPFYEFNGATLGARGTLDARAYRGFDNGRIVLAVRGQAGYVAAPSATDVPSDFLFYSGGGGTVRGFPYQSMGVDLGGGDTIGGRTFLGGSAELRYKATDTIGVVAFADAGRVGADSFFDNADWQIGAGAGLRYYTGMGPIRLDVGVPVSGPGASLTSIWDAQFYLGIGQAF
jgi:translocation and assembly module TamA